MVDQTSSSAKPEIEQDHLISNRMYDILKFVAMILLPAVGTLYFALADIWGIPAGQQVVGTITAVDVFLGVLIGVSTTSYNNSESKYDGAVSFLPGSEPGTTTMSLNVDPQAIATQSQALLKVNPVDPTATSPMAVPDVKPSQ